MSIPVILDVDTGIDDAFAILLAASSPEIELKGISTVDGNVPLRDTYRNTCYVRHLLGLDVPVAKGCAKAFVQRVPDARIINGRHGVGLVEVPDCTDKKPLNLYRFYESALGGSGAPVTIIANGPLTNIAAILLACPHLKPHIERIVFMGGSVFVGNATATAEFNIWKDPEAAQVVLSSGIPLVMAGLEITRTANLANIELEHFQNRSHPAQKFFFDILEYYMERCSHRPGSKGATMHDSVTVLYVMAPELFKGSECFVSIDTSSGPGRGTTLVDKVGISGRPKNLFMLETMDINGFLVHTRESIAWAGMREQGVL